MMVVHVKLFSLLRKYHPGPDSRAWLEVEVPEGATVRDVAARLQLPLKLVTNAFINDKQQPVTTTLRPGDRVGIFPPVAGG